MVTDPDLGVARLVWLNDGATSASAEWVKAEVAKLAYLEQLGADRLDLSVIPPERLRQLATLARRSTPRALRRMAPERRHPILLAALAAAHTEIVDETVRLFDMLLAALTVRPATGSPNAKPNRSVPTWDAWTCSTTFSTSSSTLGSTTPPSVLLFAVSGPTGWPGRHEAPTSVLLLTAAIWS